MRRPGRRSPCLLQQEKALIRPENSVLRPQVYGAVRFFLWHTIKADGESVGCATAAGGRRERGDAGMAKARKTADVAAPSDAGEQDAHRAAFLAGTWDLLEQTLALLARRLRRAMESEEEIDRLLSALSDGDAGTDLPARARTELCTRLLALKIEDIGKLTSLFGTLCEKQAQARRDTPPPAGEPLLKFEDF